MIRKSSRRTEMKMMLLYRRMERRKLHLILDKLRLTRLMKMRAGKENLPTNMPSPLDSLGPNILSDPASHPRPTVRKIWRSVGSKFSMGAMLANASSVSDEFVRVFAISRTVGSGSADGSGSTIVEAVYIFLYPDCWPPDIFTVFNLFLLVQLGVEFVKFLLIVNTIGCSGSCD